MKINEEFLLRDKNVSTAGDTINMSRHRWYYYKEGFSPSLVESAIETLGLTSSDVIIDPFNGSGTVTLTAAMKGIKSFGFEVNPFTAFIAKTKVESAN
ncbi:DNA methyltransferase, partial [Macellibacteroides fermentans]|uniref:DNA methyltransferase n=2 Tax=Bacteroidia TaxID=200643 RepID=UPI003B9242E3